MHHGLTDVGRAGACQCRGTGSFETPDLPPPPFAHLSIIHNSHRLIPNQSLDREIERDRYLTGRSSIRRIVKSPIIDWMGEVNEMVGPLD
jgi:hypothetical protein